MISSVEAQFLSILISVFAGIALGILFDLYRTINFFTRPNKFFLYIMDLLFWIVTGGAVFFILLRADFAELRIYTFAGIIIGVAIYFKLFTAYVLKLYRWIIYAAIKSIRLLFIFIMLPLKLLYNGLWIMLNYIKRMVNCLYIWIMQKKPNPTHNKADGNKKKNNKK